mmetsp:Transcript_36845/g.84918  ORF Transcript_36845/g.84918 Transcript_36845/m.84918 type:complete len:1099 (+) Transcript_36845:129-3425(+)
MEAPDPHDLGRVVSQTSACTGLSSQPPVSAAAPNSSTEGILLAVRSAEHGLHEDIVMVGEKIDQAMSEFHRIFATLQIQSTFASSGPNHSPSGMSISKAKSLHRYAGAHAGSSASSEALDRINDRIAATTTFAAERQLSPNPVAIAARSSAVARIDSSPRALPSVPLKTSTTLKFEETLSQSSRERSMRSSSQRSRQFLHPRWEGWPANLLLREELVLGYEADKFAKLKDLALGSSARRKSTSGTKMEMASGVWYRVIIHPASKRHICFKLLSIFVIVSQLFYLPYALTWENQVDDIDEAVLILTTAFWSMDLLLHFLIGYNTTDGEVELRPIQVAKHYLTTWFCIDFTCLMSDFFNVVSEFGALETNTSATRVLHLVKLQRFLRALVMIRMLRVGRELFDFLYSKLSSTLLVMLRTFQVTALILWLVHLVACAWYAIGRWAPADPDARWIDLPLPGLEQNVKDSTPLYQYMTAYHWSLGQISLGGLDVNPVNTWERVLAIACNFFGLLFGGTLVSILATTMMELRELNHDHEVKLRQLREFLIQHGVNIGIRLRVVRQVNDRIKQKDRILLEREVSALNVLSVTLLRELRYNMFRRSVRGHPLLHVWSSINEETLKHLCGEGTRMVMVLQDDELFAAGNSSNAAYLLHDGKMMYHQKEADGVVSEDESEEVWCNSWVSEASWWCYWFHVGTAVAMTQMTLLMIPSETVLEAMTRDPAANAVTLEYGVRFHKALVNCSEDYPITDVDIQHADFNDSLYTMPTEIHVICGMAALHHVIGTGGHWKLERRGHLSALQEEIKEGRSLVLLDQDGRLHRRVAITVLQVEDRPSTNANLTDDEKEAQQAKTELLTQLAQMNYETMEWRAEVHLPGAKQKSGEFPFECLQRLLLTRMSGLKEHVSATEFQRTLVSERSKQYGIGTQYVKTTCIVPFTSDLEEELSKYAHEVNLNEADAVMFSHAIHALPSKDSDATPAGEKMPATYRTRSGASEATLAAHKVYVLHGTTHCGMYMWMTGPDMEKLQAHEAKLAKLVTRIAGSLGDLSDEIMLTKESQDPSPELTPDGAAATGAYPSDMTLSDRAPQIAMVRSRRSADGEAISCI